MSRLYTGLLALVVSSPAWAGQIALNTTPDNPIQWRVSEISGGAVISSAPVYIGNTYWGSVPGFTIPFTDCDGYWYADISFTIPVGAKAPTLSVSAIGVDDRAVVELNGKVITSAGADDSGLGSMQLTDPGKNKPYKFKNLSGPINVIIKKGLKPGLNNLRVIVNNTGTSVQGMILPVTPDNPSSLGLAASLSYK